jgi:pilus assembly protein CpaB
MRGRSILFLVLAVGAAALAAVFVRGWLNAQRAAIAAKPAPVPVAATEVLVAGHAIPAGTFLKAEDLRWQPWPEGALATGYIVKDKSKDAAKDFVGAVVKAGINAGEPITESRVAKPGDRSFLAAVLKPGTRAVAVAVNPMTGVSGFVLPGDHVDVLVTHTLPSKGSDRRTITVTDTALQDLRVIAVDQTTDDQSDKAMVAKTVTLEATPKQAEKLNLIAQMGRVSLALRSLAPPDPEKRPFHPTFTVDREVSALLTDTGPVVQVVRGNKTVFEAITPAGKKAVKRGEPEETEPVAPGGDSTPSAAASAATAIPAAVTGRLP